MNIRVNSVYTSLGAGLRLVISILAVPLLVRFLGIDRYGLWSVILSISLLSVLMEFGINVALTKYLAEDIALKDWVKADQHLTVSFSIYLLIGLITLVCFWIVSPWIGKIIFGKTENPLETLLALRFTSILMFVYFIQHWLIAVEAGFMRYDIQSVIDTFIALINQVGSVAIAFWGGKLYHLMLWLIFITVIGVIIHIIRVRQLIKGRGLDFTDFRGTLSIMIRFGIFQWLSNLGSVAFAYFDRIIVNSLLGPTATGLYSAATSIVTRINQLSAMPLQVLPPALSSVISKKEKDRAQSIYQKATNLNGLVVYLIAAPIMYWSKFLALFLVGNEYVTQESNLLLNLAFVYAIYSLGAAGFYTTIGAGKPIHNAIWGIVGGGAMLVLLFILLPIYGLDGVIGANAAYVVVLIINLFAAKEIEMNLMKYLGSLLAILGLIAFWWMISLIVPAIPLLGILYKVLIFFIIGGIFAILIAGKNLTNEILQTMLSYYRSNFLNGKLVN